MNILKKIKPIKNFFSRTSRYTISAILNVPLSKVDDWANGLDSPSKDQAQHIKKINSPLSRLKRLLSNILALYFKKCFLLMSKNTIYPYWEDLSTMTNYLSTFRQNPKFIEAYAKGNEIQAYDLKSYYRIHQTIWGTSVAMQSVGDWVELGTARGFQMSAALKYHKEKWNQSSKNLWLVDTFSSFNIDPATGLQSESSGKMAEYCDDIDLVKEHFNEFHNVQFVQGLIPDCLDRIKAEKISFLHIDLNAPKPETEALSFLWDRLVKGGIILLDDYGYAKRRDQHDAMNKLALRYSFEILQMPSGQGLAIK